MKSKVRFFIMITLFLLIPSLTVSAEEPAFDIEEYTQSMQPGWNLGNTFDAVGEDETAWGNPFVTEELIQAIADQGYNSIRIPITFDQRMDGGPDYEIHEDFLDRVTNTVDWSLDAGMKVMINIHHDSWIWLESGMENNYDQTVARFEAIWLQLSQHFRDYDLDLMFESINEPRFAPYDNNQDLNYLADLNDRFYQIIRDSGGNNTIRPIVIPTMHTGSDDIYLNHLSDWLEEKNDPYAIATVHYYGFWPFSVNIAGHTTFDQETLDDIQNTFDRVHKQFTQNGIPVVIGEFGLLGFDQNVYTIQQGEKLKFFEYVIHYAQEKNLVHMLWDNGQHFDRTNYQWYDQELYEMMRASFSGRSATAERDFIFFKQDEAITDQDLTLNLNGRTFNDIYHNGEALVEGSDYSVEDSTLTLSAELLTELVDLEQLGISTELQLVFDQGANWRINLVVYDTPVVYENKDDYRTFQIPINFNGDQLATLEAFYEDGTPAGPQDWTTFKEFSYVFSPDYEADVIDFTYNEWDDHSRLFDEIRQDEAVSIRLHFWSGTTVDYEVVRSGDQVVGYLVPSEEQNQDDQNNNDIIPPENENDDKNNQEDETPSDTENNDDDEVTPPITVDDEDQATDEDRIDVVENDLDDENVDQNSTRLPETATNTGNYLIIGLVLLIISMIMLIYEQKRRMI